MARPVPAAPGCSTAAAGASPPTARSRPRRGNSPALQLALRGVHRALELAGAERALDACRNPAAAVDREHPGLGPQVEGLELGAVALAEGVVAVDLHVDEGSLASALGLHLLGYVGHRA